MVNKGLVAETELLRLKRQFNDLQAQSQERVNKYRVDAANELSKIESELAQTQEILTARRTRCNGRSLRRRFAGRSRTSG
jgi:hypothetical protein